MKSFLNVNTSFSSLGSMSIKFDGVKVDITTLRKEDGYDDSRHPSKVEFVKNTSIDYLRRDFTVNAIYIDSNGNVIDHSSGIIDLKNKVIRMIGNPDTRFKEDPLRILRAIRFSFSLGFKLDKQIIDSIENNKGLLKKLSFIMCAEEIE